MKLQELIKPKTKFTGARKHHLDLALNEPKKGKWVTTEALAASLGIERKKMSIVLLDLQKFGYDVQRRINSDYQHWFYEYKLGEEK